MSNSYGPLMQALPLSLAERSYSSPPTSPAHTTGAGPSSAASPDYAAYENNNTNTGNNGNNNTAERVATNPSQSVHSERDGLTAPQAQSQAQREEEYGFAHPAASRPQRTVWFPRDRLGLAEEEERACREAGVDVSVQRAEVDEKGKVGISGAPPGEEEEEGEVSK